MAKKKKEEKKEEKKEQEIKPTLDELIASINKEYGPGTILRASQATSLVIDRVSSGIFELDLRLGGGIPRGRITMLKGEYSTGKTAICLKTAANFQRCDRFTGKPYIRVDSDGVCEEVDFGREGPPEPMRVVWMDAEHSFDPKFAEMWGVNIDDLYLIQSEFAEQAIDVADACIRSGECDLLVVDSIAALTPSVEIENSSENWQIGVMARLINKALRKWTSGMNAGGLLTDTKCTVLLVNQYRTGFGGGFTYKTSPGGKGLDFFQSVEVNLKRNDWVEDKQTDRAVGLDVEFSITKNKTAPVAGKGKFRLFFVSSEDLGHQVGDTDTETQLLRSAVYWKFVERGGSWFTLPGNIKCQGEVNAAKTLAENKDLFLDLQKKIWRNELSWMESGKQTYAKEKE